MPELLKLSIFSKNIISFSLYNIKKWQNLQEKKTIPIQIKEAF